MWEKSFGFVVLDLSGVWVLGRDVKLGRLGLSWRWDPVGIVWNLTLQMFSLGPGFRAQDMPPNPPLILWSCTAYLGLANASALPNFRGILSSPKSHSAFELLSPYLTI